jgi:KDO2-lipid IV(A) lauroyltransferase
LQEWSISMTAEPPGNDEGLRTDEGPALVRGQGRTGDDHAWGQTFSTPPPRRPWLARSIVLLHRIIGMLPLRAVHLVATALGGLASTLPTRERHVSEVNLGIAFPDVDRVARRRLARKSMIETAKTFAEGSAIWSWNRERILEHIHDVSGEERVREAIDSGRGVILAAPHLGNWELVGIYCSTSYPLTGLYQRPRLLELESLFRASRERFGAKLVPAGLGAVRTLTRALRRGEMIGILPDQDAGSGLGVFVPFFGEPANTMTLLSRLAARTRALVVIAYAERLPRSLGFHMHFVPASEAIFDPDIERSAASLNRDVEDCVRGLPEQYLWSYKRFRIRPRGMRSPYAKPSGS